MKCLWKYTVAVAVLTFRYAPEQPSEKPHQKKKNKKLIFILENRRQTAPFCSEIHQVQRQNSLLRAATGEKVDNLSRSKSSNFLPRNFLQTAHADTFPPKGARVSENWDIWRIGWQRKSRYFELYQGNWEDLEACVASYCNIFFVCNFCKWNIYLSRSAVFRAS